MKRKIITAILRRFKHASAARVRKAIRRYNGRQIKANWAWQAER